MGQSGMTLAPDAGRPRGAGGAVGPAAEPHGGEAGQAAPAGRILIRPMEPRDLDAAARIEATAPDAWSREALESGLRQQAAGGAARLFVAEWAERAEPAAPGTVRLAGLAAFQLAGGEASLDTLTVDPALRRQGVGRALLNCALRALAAEGAGCCFLEVREGNAPALALYQSLGFAAVGRRRNFYRTPDEDALVLRCELPAAEACSESTVRAGDVSLRMV